MPEIYVSTDVEADGPIPGPPMPTEVAVTVFEESAPKTITWVPTVTSAREADALPNSL